MTTPTKNSFGKGDPRLLELEQKQCACYAKTALKCAIKWLTHTDKSLRGKEIEKMVGKITKYLDKNVDGIDFGITLLSLPMGRLTKRLSETYVFIKNFILLKGFAPTEKEIGAAIGVASRGVIHRYIHALEKEGYLIIIPNKKRNIKLVSKEKIK